MVGHQEERLYSSGYITVAEGGVVRSMLGTGGRGGFRKEARAHNSLVSRLPAARYNPLGAINICNSRAACLERGLEGDGDG